MEAYQEKLSADWETAKNSYQAKINDIMSSFIKEKGLDKESDFSILFPDDSEKKSTPKKLENILARVERLLKPRDSKFTIPLWKSSSGDIYERGSKWSHYSRHPLTWFALLLTLSASAYLFFRTPPPIALPYPHTSGLVVGDEKIYIVDWLRKSMFVHKKDGDLSLLSVENMPNDFLAGLAIAKNKVVSLNSFSSQILIHDTSPEHLIVDKQSAPGTQAVGMYFDGLDLWTIDEGAKKLTQYRGLDAGEVKEEFNFAGSATTGLVVENGRVWILSKKSRSLSLFRLEDPLRHLAVYDLDPLLQGAVPTSFDIKEKNLWLTTESPATLRKTPLRTLTKNKTI